MARGLNKATIIGHLGADPELRYTGSGTAVCNMRVATNESYKDADGNLVEHVEWHSVVAWGKLAEICGEWLKKGSQAYFEGSLQTRKWQDKEGADRYTTEIKAREMMMLGGTGGEAHSNGQQRSEQPQQKQQTSRPKAQASAPASYPPEDDLPF